MSIEPRTVAERCRNFPCHNLVPHFPGKTRWVAKISVMIITLKEHQFVIAATAGPLVRLLRPPGSAGTGEARHTRANTAPGRSRHRPELAATRRRSRSHGRRSDPRTAVSL